MEQYTPDDIVRALEAAMTEMDPETRDRWVTEYDVDKILAILIAAQAAETDAETVTDMTTEDAEYHGTEEEGTNAEVEEDHASVEGVVETEA